MSHTLSLVLFLVELECVGRAAVCRHRCVRIRRGSAPEDVVESPAAMSALPTVDHRPQEVVVVSLTRSLLMLLLLLLLLPLFASPSCSASIDRHRPRPTHVHASVGRFGGRYLSADMIDPCSDGPFEYAPHAIAGGGIPEQSICSKTRGITWYSVLPGRFATDAATAAPAEDTLCRMKRFAGAPWCSHAPHIDRIG